MDEREIRTPECIRVLSADDHPLIREGIAALLANQTDIVLVAALVSALVHANVRRTASALAARNEAENARNHALEAVMVLQIQLLRLRAETGRLVQEPEEEASEPEEEFEFDEAWYLERYPDVRAAIQAELIPSGREHYRRHGRGEGRKPVPDKVAAPAG